MKKTALMCSAFLLSLSSCGGSTPVSSVSDPVKEDIFTLTTFQNELRMKEADFEGVNMKLYRKGKQNRSAVIAGSDDGVLEASFQEGDSIEIESSGSYIVFSGFGVEDLLLYSPRGSFVIEVPKGKMKNAINSSPYLGNQEIEARLASPDDLQKERNLALNPFDQMHIDEYNPYNDPNGAAAKPIDDSYSIEEEAISFFPHAYASRVTRNDVTFFPRNAIDGQINAEGHGNYPYESWGYDQKEDATYTLYFGRKVSLSKLSLVLRHDTASNHDCAWSEATFEYEGGETKGEFVFTGERQDVEFDEDVVTSYIRIKDIHADKGNSQGYAALTEIEAYGNETVSVNPAAKKRAIRGTFGRKDQSNARTSLRKDEILDAATRANEEFMRVTQDGTLRIPMYDITRTETVSLGEQEWKDSIYYSGLTDFVLTSADEESYEYLKGIGESYLYKCNGGSFTAHGDWYQCGETFMTLGDMEGSFYQAKQPKENLDWILSAYPNAPTGSSNSHQDSGRDWTHGGWWWCDALYMAMNSYTLLSNLTGEDKYVTMASQAYDYAKAKLYDDHYHLWHRDESQLTLKTDVDDPDTHAKYASFWSRGNAWVFAALAKQLLYLDEGEFPDLYEKYSDDFVEMAEALLKYQREDGLWNVAITPYKAYEGMEITGTCGFIYGFAVGSALGILDENEYMPAADLAYETIIDRCFLDGGDRLGYMQTVGYQPQNYVSEEFTRPITDEFGMGLFLLASSALIRSTPDYEAPDLVIPAARQGYYFS